LEQVLPVPSTELVSLCQVRLETPRTASLQQAQSLADRYRQQLVVRLVPSETLLVESDDRLYQTEVRHSRIFCSA